MVEQEWPLDEDADAERRADEETGQGKVAKLHMIHRLAGDTISITYAKGEALVFGECSGPAKCRSGEQANADYDADKRSLLMHVE